MLNDCNDDINNVLSRFNHRMLNLYLHLNYERKMRIFRITLNL